jgi:hypothetical protein
VGGVEELVVGGVELLVGGLEGGGAEPLVAEDRFRIVVHHYQCRYYDYYY